MHTDFSTKDESPSMLYTSTGIFVLKNNLEIGRAEILQWIRGNADRDTLNMVDIAVMERHDVLYNEEEAQRDPRSIDELVADMTRLAKAL